MQSQSKVKFHKRNSLNYVFANALFHEKVFFLKAKYTSRLRLMVLEINGFRIGR